MVIEYGTWYHSKA